MTEQETKALYVLCIATTGELGLVTLGRDDEHALEGCYVPDALVRWFHESTSAALTALASSAGFATLQEANSLREHGGPLPAPWGFWRSFSRRYFTALCRQYSHAAQAWETPRCPDDETLDELIRNAPPMRGLEHLTIESLRAYWQALDEHTRDALKRQKVTLADYLRQLDSAWNLVGRVTFHLAENKKQPDKPFAFMATFTEGQSAAGAPKHVPLSEALKRSIETGDQAKLDELLEPVVRASKTSKLVGKLLDSRQLFAPQAWAINTAFEFLSNVPALEEAGVVVRVPNWWNAAKPPRPQVSVSIGNGAPGNQSTLSPLDFQVDVAIDGEPLTDQELKQLLAAREGLMLLRGKWIQVDRDKLTSALSHWQQLADQHTSGIDFLQAMRLLSGVNVGSEVDEGTRSWTRVEPGPALREILNTLRSPDGEPPFDPEEDLQAQLRDYQVRGVHWLWFATRLGLGVCLADDMGLGKTIQVIALLLQLKRESSQATRAKSNSTDPASNHRTHLLILPTSLLGNWRREVARFAPGLRILVAHRSMTGADVLKQLAKDPERVVADYDLVVTTYGMVRNAEWIKQAPWHLVILDEAQAIKNAGATQTRAIKQIPARSRIILTGTPVENHLGDLWSLFDFCSPGLLGSAVQFRRFASAKDDDQYMNRIASLRKLVRPYILRRLKTDPTIAPDLPSKTEMRVECGLSPIQAGLYQQALDEFEKVMDVASGMQRRGLVLGLLMQLKQICNHPSLYLKDDRFAKTDSGKFAELASIAKTLVESQEKCLVFTQFQSMCDPLHDFLAEQFSRPGLVLTGKTAAGSRNKLVNEFQQPFGPPFFVISVKAGGVGLNLTEACHVIHFDRWWNPAVESQATDRAFRIGQKRNVLVHKFVCRGTLEERIDDMIESKKKISQQLFADDGQLNLTEMSNEELLEFVSLDLDRSTI